MLVVERAKPKSFVGLLPEQVCSALRWDRGGHLAWDNMRYPMNRDTCHVMLSGGVGYPIWVPWRLNWWEQTPLILNV